MGVLCRAGQLGVDFSVEAMQEQLSLLRALRAEELSNENNVAVTASSMTTGVKVRCVRVALTSKNRSLRLSEREERLTAADLSDGDDEKAAPRMSDAV